MPENIYQKTILEFSLFFSIRGITTGEAVDKGILHGGDISQYHGSSYTEPTEKNCNDFIFNHRCCTGDRSSSTRSVWIDYRFTQGHLSG